MALVGSRLSWIASERYGVLIAGYLGLPLKEMALVDSRLSWIATERYGAS